MENGQLSALQGAMLDAGVVQSAFTSPAAALLIEELLRRSPGADRGGRRGRALRPVQPRPPATSSSISPWSSRAAAGRILPSRGPSRRSSATDLRVIGKNQQARGRHEARCRHEGVRGGQGGAGELHHADAPQPPRPRPDRWTSTRRPLRRCPASLPSSPTETAPTSCTHSPARDSPSLRRTTFACSAPSCGTSGTALPRSWPRTSALRKRR